MDGLNWLRAAGSFVFPSFALFSDAAWFAVNKAGGPMRLLLGAGWEWDCWVLCRMTGCSSLLIVESFRVAVEKGE